MAGGEREVGRPEDVGERAQEAPQHNVLQNEDDADGQILLPGLVHEEERQQDGQHPGDDVAAHAKHELHGTLVLS